MQSKDEVGLLLIAMQDMVNNLQQIIYDVRLVANNVVTGSKTVNLRRGKKQKAQQVRLRQLKNFLGHGADGCQYSSKCW